MNSKKGGGCCEHGGVRKAPTAFVFQRRNTPADFTRHRWWQSPHLPVSLVLSALTSAPFSVAEGIQLVCWLFFSLTQMFLKSLPRFTTLSTSISCYTVLSILLGNSVSLSLFSISVSSCHFFSLIEIVKKPASISSLSPMVSLFTDSLLAFWLGRDFFFVQSEALVFLGIWVPLCWLFCDIPQLCFISLFNHPPPCRGSC